jgi:hypothetical protein
LYKQAADLTRKRETLRIQQQKLEKNQLSSPNISLKSRYLTGNRVGKIEDRLLAQGKRKVSEDPSLSQERIPKISDYAKSMKSDKPVVERLLVQGYIYEARKKANLASSAEFSFMPKINSYSTNVSRSDLYSPKAPAKAQVSFNFQPELDKNSLKIASRLGEFGNRNTSRNRNRSMSIEEFSFKPKINKTSSEASINATTGNVSGNGDRWQQLYDLNLQRRERLALLRKNFEETEKDFECTFHPKTCKPLVKGSADPAQRLNDWETRRLLKLNQARETSVDKDSDECTFRPFLYGNLACQTTFTDFYVDSDKKKKKNYVEIHKAKFTPDKIEWKSDKVAPLFISDINSNEYDEAIKELHDLLHVGLKRK